MARLIGWQYVTEFLNGWKNREPHREPPCPECGAELWEVQSATLYGYGMSGEIPEHYECRNCGWVEPVD